jgi:metal-sulfur cluster biosynthetic enzyme
VSVYDLGLVRDWTLDDTGHLEVRMCVTAPLCLMARNFLDAARAELERLPGITSARCWVDPTVTWTPRDMSDEGAAGLRSRRERSMREVPVHPRQWRERP